MTSTTNLPNGVTNADSNSAMGTLTQLDPTKLHTYFNDFNLYNAADWVVTVTQTGSGSATQTIIDEAGGVLQLTNDDAIVDSIVLQFSKETFKFVSGKKLYFKVRMKVSDITSEFIIGLAKSFNFNDSVFFSNGQGASAARIEFEVKKNNNPATAIVANNLSNDTYFELAFVYDGESEIQYWHDDVLIGALDTTNSLPDDEELTVTFSIGNRFTPISKSMSIDYVYVANER